MEDKVISIQEEVYTQKEVYTLIKFKCEVDGFMFGVYLPAQKIPSAKGKQSFIVCGPGCHCGGATRL